MDSFTDEAKLFIGGIGWDTTEERLRDHFSHYGEVAHTVVMRDRLTSQPRGFGFVVFSDPSVIPSVLQQTHTIDGRTVEAKRAMSREQQQTLKTATNTTAGNFSPSDNPKSKKIFVGGLPSTLTEDEFRQYFEEYGNVTDVVIMYDSTTGRPRGFGFITFTSEDCVDRVLQKTFHELKGKLVEVKRALPKDAAASRGPPRTFSNFSTNESYNSPLGNSRMVAQPPQAGGYPQYYGYAGNSNPGYGVYGNTNPAGVYGNLSMPNTDFLKNQWGSHNQQGSYSGYGQTANYGGGSMPWGDASRNSGGYGAGGRPPSKIYGYNGYGGDDAANAYGGGNHEGNWRPEN